MKTILISKSANASLKAIIKGQSDVSIKMDLYGREDGEYDMLCLYDDSTDQISFFNKLSKEKTAAYKAIYFISGDPAAFLCVLSRLRKRLSLVMSAEDQCAIAGIREFQDDNFSELIKDSCLDNPVLFKVHQSFGTHPIPHVFMAEKLSDELNLCKLSFGIERKRDGVVALLYSYVDAYSIKDEEGFFGCPISEFIKALKVSDVKSLAEEMIVSGNLASKVKSVEVFNMETPGKSHLCPAIWIIRKGKEIIALSDRVFLDAVDCSKDLMENTLHGIISSDKIEDEIRLVPGKKGLSHGRSELVEISNILNFKKYKLSLANGR